MRGEFGCENTPIIGRHLWAQGDTLHSVREVPPDVCPAGNDIFGCTGKATPGYHHGHGALRMYACRGYYGIDPEAASWCVERDDKAMWRVSGLP